MAVTPGTRLGVYDISAQIGQGGMGQVFRARDTKLDRQVAIKILPEAFAYDADRLARFQREAKTLASLNHPNIAAIYGLEESGGIVALVMELVEGEDLSQRIARGAIPLDEALPIAKQLAEALEAAHEQGIIHRDLKPANIKVRADGTVKVLDFGLAKAMDQAPGSGLQASGALMNSPTLTSPALMTGVGMILGTAAYMSPEQSKGRAVDKRSDVWAFGAVLFEMLSGRRAFEGEDVSDTLARILMKEPDWTALPATVPSGVVTVLQRCLQRDRKQRVRDIGDVSLALDGAFEAAAPRDTVHGPRPTSAATRALPWAIASVAVIVAGVLLTLRAPWRPTPMRAPRKLLANIGAEASLPIDVGASAILSPDGMTLAFVAQQANQTRLFVRKLDQLQASALAGTEDAASPFFSPDGRWLAFFAGGKLKKVSTTGGAPVNLCDVSNGRGGTWAADDTILFTPSGLTNAVLMRVSAGGGTPVAFGTLGTGAVTQRWPQALPGGKAVLYTEHSAVVQFDGATLVVASLSGGTRKVVVRGGYYGRYVPSGHLIYLQQGTLFAVPFDLNRLETIGQAVPVVEGVAANPRVTGGAQLAVSSDGTLVYVPGPLATGASPIDWLTRDGKTSVLRATRAAWSNPRFSPDGQKLALDISDGTQLNIWVYEWARDTLTQLTFDAGSDWFPVWTPDGRRIVFASDRAKRGSFNLYEVNADGTGEVTRLTDSPESQLPFSWHPSGKFLAFQAAGATGPDLMILPMEGDAGRGWTPGKPTVFLGTPATETAPMFSPDGRWIAYLSNEGGTTEVYVRPFPGPGGKWRISTAGGSFPRWSATTHELLFRLRPIQGTIMTAPYTVVGESFRAQTPQLWSPTSLQVANATGTGYDLHPDGQRVATFAEAQATSVHDEVVFFFNFVDYLRNIAPGTK